MGYSPEAVVAVVGAIAVVVGVVVVDAGRLVSPFLHLIYRLVFMFGNYSVWLQWLRMVR
jgi:hypothetical protein